MDVLKKALPVLIGLLSGILIISFGENVTEYIYPLPENFDLNNETQVADYVRDMPVAAYLAILAIYGLAAFSAGIIATAITKKNNKGLRSTSPRPALICGIILTVACGVNAISLPHPWWFIVISILISLPASYTGFLLLRRIRAMIRKPDAIS